MAIELTDDGTMDTVLRCSECGEKMRYAYDGEPAGAESEDSGDGYDAFIDWAIDDATADHECPNDPDAEPTEPQEDDLTTTDHETFYQYGKAVLTAKTPITGTWAIRTGNGPLQHFGTFATCESALRAYMDRVQFWPNVWFISDHGNAHLIDLTEGK